MERLRGLVTFLWRRQRRTVDRQMVLTLALVESALQLVPQEIQSHPQIKRSSRQRGKKPNQILMDRAFHHSAMQQLAKRTPSMHPEKMGRPDIVHTTLLQILETPLNWEGELRVLIHTQDNHIITINPKVRLPKNYIRFIGLIEQLFDCQKVPEEGEPLLTLEKGGLLQLVRKLEPSKVLAFSRLGKPALIRRVAEHSSNFKKPLALIGGFPRGHFTEDTKRLADEILCVDRESLDAWVVAGRFVYDFEWSIGLAQNRLKPEK